MTIIEFIAVLSLILAILSLIFTGYQWFRTHKLNLRVFNLESKKLDPYMNIWGARGYRTESDPKLWYINFSIDNSGSGPANFVQFYWILISKEGKKYSSKIWKDYHQETWDKTSYIRGFSERIGLYDTLELNEVKEKDFFEILIIWLKYFDNRNLEWYAFALFKKSNSGDWIPSKKSRSYRKRS